MSEVSSRFLKVSSQIEIPEDLQFQKEYVIRLTGTVVQRVVGDEQDGTVKVIFKLKPTEVEIE